MSRRALLAVITAVAVLFAGVGWFLGQRIKSPAEIAAERAAPEPSLITVAAEMRELNQTVILRGTLAANESSELSVSSDIAPIITATPKNDGQTINEGNVLVEVAGRPVVALEGILPGYRSFSAGTEGPDVKQLQRSLSRLGLKPGQIDGVYSTSTAAAVSRLYTRVGYKAPKISEAILESVNQAQKQVANSQSQLELAKQSLAEAKQANQIQNIAFNFQDEEILEPGGDFDAGPNPGEGEENIATDIPSLERAVTRASEDLKNANSDLAKIRSEAIVSFPTSEFKFIKSLPQNVLNLKVKVGDSAKESVMSISGSDILVNSSITASERGLIKIGDTANMSDNIFELKVKITSISETANDAGRYDVKLEAVDTIPDGAVGVNMKIVVPIVSTNGKVLAVPISALTSSGSGSVSVEVERSEGNTETVKVRPGLKSEGFVEVKILDGNLKAGDRLVVGRDLVLPGDEAAEDESE